MELSDRNFGYGVVIKLNSEFASRASSLNEILASELPILDNPKNIWHVTLYHGVYKEEDLPKIWDEITKIDFTNIRLNFSEIYTTHTLAHSWVDWLVEKTPQLTAIHEAVVHAASPYHQAKLPRCVDAYDKMIDAAKTQVDQYGVSGLFEFYKPHTTLFYHHPRDGALDEASKALEVTYKMSCSIEEVIFGKLGYDGNVLEEIYTHKVQVIGAVDED